MSSGAVCLTRYDLRPESPEDLNKLKALENSTSVIPLDCYLGLANLPLKMTPEVMIKVAYYAQNQGSYGRAKEELQNRGYDLDEETVRNVANFIGNLIFENDKQRAIQASLDFKNSNLDSQKEERDGVLYIETDGAALNTREKNKDNSTWREKKLGVVFSSDNIKYWTDKHGKKQHKILIK